MNQVDTTRHASVFSAQCFGNKRIDVIGAGATGSRIVLALAKLGIQNIHVWDFDSVEEHNIANQAYTQADIGRLKVDALKDLVKRSTGLEITTHAEKVDGTQELGEVVFLLTDTMSSRKEIWQKGIRYKSRTKLMIETRMGVDEGRVYAINPIKPAQIQGWESTLYDDQVADASACGARTSVGPTAEIVSGAAVWQFMRWFGIQNGKKGTVSHEVIFLLDPHTFLTREFD
jgi:ThiF family